MTLRTTRQPAPRSAGLVGGTLLGTGLVAAGLTTAYLVVATPLVDALVGNASTAAVWIGVWSFALVAGGALLVAGTNQLAVIVSVVKGARPKAGPAMRALASLPDDAAVATAVALRDGAPIPELVIGAFGVAVIHDLAAIGPLRRGLGGWEMRVGDGWHVTEGPLDGAMRDAERVRHWLSLADLDFVVRVYAAVVVADRTLERSPSCAVVTVEQIPAWIASLPRQRSLSAARRARMLAMAQATTGPAAAPAASGAGQLRREGW